MELALGVVISGSIIAGYLYLQKSNTIRQGYVDKMAFFKTFKTGTQESVMDIIRTYETVNATVSTTNTKWGWSKSSQVNPFPIMKKYSGIPHVVYELQGGIISASALSSLRSKISSHYRDVCHDVTAKLGGTRNVVIYCPLLTDIRYDLPTGATNATTPFTKGTAIYPESPTVNIKYKKYDGLNNSFTIDTFKFTMDDTFTSLQNVSSERILTIRNAMESFSVNKKLKELRNPQRADGSGGLNSADDEFVAWNWEMFGNNTNSVKTTICVKGVGGGICGNLNTNNIWRTGTNIKRGLITKRLTANLFAGDTSFNVDGFGNAIYIYPITSDCTGTDFMACSIKAPIVPRDNYINNGLPPYLSLIYTEPFKKKTSASKSYGKMYVSY